MFRAFCLIALSIAISMLIICSCKGMSNRNSTQGNETTLQYSIASTASAKPVRPITIHIDANLVPLYDTLSTDNLIESIKYIPLSSEPAAMIIRGGSYKKVADKYIVDYGNFLHRIYKIFNSEGQYECDAFDYGRGPKEISMAYGDAVDSNNNELIIFDSGKILYHNILTHEKRIRRIDNMDLYNSYLMGTNDAII